MTTTATTADHAFMRRALELAERGWGRVHPNPLVGAVVVRDGEVVGVGYHEEWGGPHAEVRALGEAGERARGATLYVTLEPCNHTGKTPPCTDAVLRAGIRRVVIAARDPNPRAGGGVERLRAAGVEVVTGVEEGAALEQNAAFFHDFGDSGRPWLALKYGLTLDARISLEPGRRTAVTGEAAWAEVHRLRAGFDAILVGSATALADDPLLTARGEITPRVPPVRIVIDSMLRLPLESRLVRTVGEAPVWVICGPGAPAASRAALEAAGVRVIEAPTDRAGVVLGAALEILRAAGIRSVLCEGGGRLGAGLLESGLVDRMYLFYGPRLFGEGGVAAFPGRVGEPAAGEWRVSRVKPVGGDVLMVLDRNRE